MTIARYLDLAMRWIGYGIMLLVIYMLILKLTNHSPLLETVTGGMIIAVLINIGRTENHMETTKKTFTRIRYELDEIKKEVRKIDVLEKKIDFVDTRLARIEQKLGA